ncbi:MAG: DUF4810 domain-containing protein [Gammaproteobacteria bacterium]|nr:DUF4810 domain-containing protein [Gammaproteobacteria bacterium]
MQKKLLISLSLSAVLLTGCVVAPPHATGFYWGNYSRTLYEYQKTPSPSTLEAHRNSLQDIIARADSGQSKVPPGIYAELGKLHLDKGEKAEAVKWFQQEVAHYPESGVLMKTLIEKAG